MLSTQKWHLKNCIFWVNKFLHSASLVNFLFRCYSSSVNSVKKSINSIGHNIPLPHAEGEAIKYKG
ncbi:MAG: hypothetical protein CVV37_06820 [Nitrospira bacterium HGW-Nitrospira-1]|nr:MAG: hypothetical protein CVV37_06820 [Nitrospira bacterium HGW-Nitrospira-1]